MGYPIRMKSSFLKWSTVMIVCLTATGLSMRGLALQGIPVSESLIFRGVICLLLVFAWAFNHHISLIPKSIKTQFLRALIAGMALSFFSISYYWLSASAVSVLSNIDVPILILLGSLVGQVSTLRSKLLSLVSIVLLVIYGTNIQHEKNWLLGVSILGAGIFLLCFGYYFIKKSMHDENRVITILTPSLAIIFYGFLQMGMSTSLSWSRSWDFYSILLATLSGVGMFGAYYSTMELYAQTDIATAEFPTLISALAIQPLESLWFHQDFILYDFLISLLFVITTYFILTNEKNKVEALDLPQVPQSLEFTCGAACFESMYRYLKGISLGELHFAEKLGTFALGYTQPEKIAELAADYGFFVELAKEASFEMLNEKFHEQRVIFVTWWDEDAGHYSLIKSINKDYIFLMDPWEARQGKDKQLKITQFQDLWKARGSVMISIKQLSL